MHRLNESSPREIKFMSYNLWGGREDVALYRRMQAIGDLVREEDPDVIFFQEATHYILMIFDSLGVLTGYKYGRLRSLRAARRQQCFCLLPSKLPLDRFDSRMLTAMPPFHQSLQARVKPGSGMAPILVSTARLKALADPTARLSQAERFASPSSRLGDGAEDNVLVGGDTRWDDDADLPFPLPRGWVDAWTHLRPHRADLAWSWTYDAVWEEELAEFNGFVAPRSSLRRRSDRFLCKLKDYSLKGIELIGSDGLGIWYLRKGSSRPDSIELPPSCHCGLVLTVVPSGPIAPDVSREAGGQTSDGPGMILSSRIRWRFSGLGVGFTVLT